MYIILIVLIRASILRRTEIIIVGITLIVMCFVLGPLECYMTMRPEKRAEWPLWKFFISPGTFTYAFIILSTFIAYHSVLSYKRIATVLFLSLIYFAFLHNKVFRHWLYAFSYGRSGPVVDKDISQFGSMISCNNPSDTIDFMILTDKIVVIDAWSQFCGGCF